MREHCIYPNSSLCPYESTGGFCLDPTCSHHYEAFPFGPLPPNSSQVSQSMDRTSALSKHSTISTNSSMSHGSQVSYPFSGQSTVSSPQTAMSSYPTSPTSLASYPWPGWQDFSIDASSPQMARSPQFNSNNTAVSAIAISVPQASHKGNHSTKSKANPAPSNAQSNPPQDRSTCTSVNATDGRYYCLWKNCNKNFSRAYDCRRHSETHWSEDDKPRFDCQEASYIQWCHRKGKKGFTREDHRDQHRRKVHGIDIPRKPRGVRNKK